MRTRLIILGFILILFICDCKKDNNSSSDFPYNAIVLGLNSDCSKYEIKITNGLEKVKTIVGVTSNDSVYIAANLPDSLKVTGLNIQLDLRKPNNEELSACKTFGPIYPWIYVIKAINTTCPDSWGFDGISMTIRNKIEQNK